VFIVEWLTLPVPLTQARYRLTTYLHTNGPLRRACAAALAQGLTGALPDGEPLEPVVARTLPAHQRGNTTVIGLRSTITASWATDSLPILDADLELRPGADHTARLGLLGSFRLPGTVDSAHLEQAAQHTTTNLLRRIATALNGNELARSTSEPEPPSRSASSMITNGATPQPDEA
jgi:hypothetical protein